MALIGDIRKNSWLLILTIGLALAAFIIMDMTSGDKSIFGSSRNVAGTINGEKIDWNEFTRAENILYGSSNADVFERKASLWNYFVEDKVVSEEADKLGLGISRDELRDLQFSQDQRKLSPLIIQRYSDPNTRQLKRADLDEIKNAIDNKAITNNEFITRWGFQEKEIIKARKQSKLEELVAKSIYTPTWMAEMINANDQQKVDFQYVKIPFDNVDDAQVNLTDADYENFLKENRALYELDEEVRKVDYVVFNAVATQEDENRIFNGLRDLLPEFRNATNDTLFTENNFGSLSTVYQKASDFNAAFADTLFQVANGTVVGPFKNGNTFVAYKVLDRKVIPDSVRSRHILMGGSTQEDYSRAYATLDSLKNVLESGAESFDSLAVRFSQGPSASKGGDLGYVAQGAMVPQFNNLIFHNAKEGEYNIIPTQFGLHLVEVTGFKYVDNIEGVKVATLSQNIVPSENTISEVNNKALAFVDNINSVDEMISAAEADPSINVETSQPLKKNDYSIGTLGSGQTARDIVKWAFNKADVGDVSSQVYIYQNPNEFYDEKFIIAGLRSVQEAGLPSVDFIRDDIAIQVNNYKKGQMIKEAIEGKDMSTLSSLYPDATIETANGLSFSAGAIPNVGVEPKVIASAFAVAQNTQSAPVIGNNGVYVVKPLSKSEIAAATNIPTIRKNTNNTMSSQMRGQVVQGLIKKADIEDNRSASF